MKFISTLIFFALFFQQIYAQVQSEKDVLTRGSPIYCLAYSNDGKMVATGGGDNTVRILNTSNWEEMARLKGLRGIPLSICFSDDGKYVAAGGKDNQITIWTVQNQMVAQVLKGHREQIMDIEFSPDSKFVASASLDKTIRYWNANTGALVSTLIGHKKGVTALDFSPNGDQLVSGSADETVNIWDIKTGGLKKTIMAHTNWVRAVAYSPDGSLIASGGDDMQIQIWDAVSGKKLNTFLGHKKWVQTLAFSPDGNYLLSGGHDNIIILTDLRTGKMVFRSKHQSNFILSVGFNPNGETFASSALYSQELQVWNARALNIKPVDKIVAQKMSKSSGMIPKVTWVSPAQSTVVNTASAKINASIYSESSLRSIELYLNGKLFATKDRSELMLETAESETTNYIETAVLQEGANTLLIKAKNIVGEGISEQITLTYTAAQAKMVTWLNPSLPNTESNSATFDINALIAPASSAQVVYVLVNNITQSTINLPATGGMVAKTIALNAGANNVKFLVQTNEFTREADIRIITLAQANKPVVSWSLPSKDTMSFISSCRVLAAVVSQVSLDKIEVHVNGVPVLTKLQLQESQYIIDNLIQLVPGINKIEVVALNNAGETVSVPRLVTYELPVKSNVSWVLPTGHATVNNSILELNACIQSKQKISRIIVYNNNIPVLTDDQVQVSPIVGECNVAFKRPVVLNPGLNVLKITAQTASEVISTEALNITYSIPQPATISWLNPVGGQLTSSEPTVEVQACINSNTPLEQVVVMSNNQIIATLVNPLKTTEGCTFNLNQVIPLSKGDNTIVIKAKNISGESLSTPSLVGYKTVNPYRFALIIGNEDYSSFQAELDSESDVDFALNDARDFKKTCENTLGISSDNIVYLENARYIEMRKALKKINGIIQVTNGKADVIVYYAGHGFPDEKTKEPYLVPVDGSGSDLEFSAIKLSYFYEQLTEFQADRVTVFIDACFSGGARNQGLVAARGVKVVPKETQDAVTKKLIVFTASSGNQTSLPYSEKSHGMFTYFLIKKIEESGSALTYKELSDYVSEQVGIKSFMINSKKQEPQTNVSPEIQEVWGNWTFQ